MAHERSNERKNDPPDKAARIREMYRCRRKLMTIELMKTRKSTDKEMIGGDDTKQEKSKGKIEGGEEDRRRSGKPKRSRRKRGRRTHHLQSGFGA